MKLLKYNVMNFRSVRDSGWVETDRVTALIGENESGKSNLLLPLWKLNPAREGEIQPTSDYPKALFNEIRANPANYAFVTAIFECGEDSFSLAAVAGISPESAEKVQVTRDYAGTYTVEFPMCDLAKCVPANSIREPIQALLTQLNNGTPTEAEAQFIKDVKGLLPELIKLLPEGETLPFSVRVTIKDKLSQSFVTEAAKTATNQPLATPVIQSLKSLEAELSKPDPNDSEEVVNAVLTAMPKFVYYANYGNLDSEIYLPRAIEDLKRKDLGPKDAAKARTLRVLFKFVGLEPNEILELGRDFKDPQGRQPTPEEVAKIAEAKRTRSILMQSASTRLTQKFKAWWKRGDYRFRFQADGDHFRIWVSDDRRPEEIELEARSTGLQWFLSFFLVFLVESEEEHKRAILLLDEPGMSLHPLAQRDLSDFFEGLSETNPLLYTSHSPFLVQADRLDRARKVYVDRDGSTKASADLRKNAGDPQPGAAYAVHSAINLGIAESLLIGCTPIIVDGPSDQHYLTTIKTLLVSAGQIQPQNELVFPPAGGAKTARIIASILTGRDEQLPIILSDDDAVGRSAARELAEGLYAKALERLLSLKDFVFENAEVEDLFPSEFLADIFDRALNLPRTEEDIRDAIQAGKPFVDQVETWAKSNNIELPKHWKVDLALEAKKRALKGGISQFDEGTIGRWKNLFEAFLQSPQLAKATPKRSK